MIPYWKTIMIILLLLIVQVFCDLALPTYTADILDVGIQNRGVEHILPTKMTEEEYEYAKLFMTEEEAENWDDCYVKEGDVYTRVEMEKEALDALDEAFIVPVMLR